MWFIGVEVEQETSAPAPKKNPGSAAELCIIMKNFSRIVAWYSADRIPGILLCSSNISISLIFILNSKIALVFETEMLNWTANEESLWRVGRFFI